MKFNLLNPLFYYIFSFVFVLILYQLNWSILYPELTFDLYIFLFFTIFLSLPLYVLFNKIIKDSFFYIANHREVLFVSKNQVNYLNFALILMMLLEFLYSRGIPLISVVLGGAYNYKEFGIPVIHVVILPYLSAVGITYFYRYVIFRNKYYLMPFYISLLFPLLIVNRSAFIFIIFSCMIIYLIFNYSLKKIITIALSLIILLYGFGYLGNLRMKAVGYENDDAILKVGGASQNFEDSSVPTEFFWSYLYLTSPVANLQVAKNSYLADQRNSVSTFLLNSIVVDAVSKRLAGDIFRVDTNERELIDESLNVSTLYGESVTRLGVIGGFFLFFYYLIFLFFFTLVCPKKFRLAILSILCVMSFFCIFTNFLRLSSFVMQLIIIGLVSKIKLNRIKLI